jgi:hypothetical protein
MPAAFTRATELDTSECVLSMKRVDTHINPYFPKTTTIAYDMTLLANGKHILLRFSDPTKLVKAVKDFDKTDRTQHNVKWPRRRVWVYLLQNCDPCDLWNVRHVTYNLLTKRLTQDCFQVAIIKFKHPIRYAQAMKRVQQAKMCIHDIDSPQAWGIGLNLKKAHAKPGDEICLDESGTFAYQRQFDLWWEQWLRLPLLLRRWRAAVAAAQDAVQKSVSEINRTDNDVDDNSIHLQHISNSCKQRD